MKVEDTVLRNGESCQMGALFTSDGVGPTAVLFLHGYKSNRSGYAEYAEALTGKLGTTCLTLDLAGHGASSGDITEISARQHLSDIKVAYDFLAEQEQVDESRVGIVGASYGGYLAVLLSQEVRKERTPKGLLLRAPAIYPDESLDTPRALMSEAENNEFRKQLAASEPPNRALSAIRNFGGKFTIVESEKDESILPEVIQAYARAAANGTHEVIKDARHSLVGEHRQIFKGILLAWAREL